MNKSGRKIFHVECDSFNLFHWSKKINEKESNFFVSNRQEDKKYHDQSQKLFSNKKNKTLDERINELDANLNSLKLSNKKSRRKIALQLERQALQIPKPSVATQDYISDILTQSSKDDQIQSSQEKKSRGRPKKIVQVEKPVVVILIIQEVKLIQDNN